MLGNDGYSRIGGWNPRYGAAGLTCSTCETASRGDSGIEIDLDLVPQRETGMNSYEIMLSESQENARYYKKGQGARVRGSV